MDATYAIQIIIFLSILSLGPGGNRDFQMHSMRSFWVTFATLFKKKMPGGIHPPKEYLRPY